MKRPILVLIKNILDLLYSGNWYSMDEAVTQLKTSKPTLFRYFKLLNDGGFYIGNKNGKYKILAARISVSELQDLLHITEKQAEDLFNKIPEMSK